MKYNILKYTLATGAAILMTGCAHFLDEPTDTRVELVNTDQLKMLMNSAYPVSNYAWPCEIMSDNIEDNNSRDKDKLHYNLPSMNRGEDEMFAWQQCVSSTNPDTPAHIWTNFYSSIAACNAVLEKLDQWDVENGGLTPEQEALRAEALMLRAYDHFILAQVFCQPYRGSLSDAYLGIPYPTRPETTVLPHYERGTLAQTYANIQHDLEEALPKIDDGIYTVTKYHFNKAAANAFAARFYLYTRQYRKALDAANAAFGGEGVNPTGFLTDVWNKVTQFYYLTDIGLYQNGYDKPHNFLLYATYSSPLSHMASGYRYGVIRNALYSTLYSSSPCWSSFEWNLTSGKGTTFVMHPALNGVCTFNAQSEYGIVMAGNAVQHFEYLDKIAGTGYIRATRREFYGEETLLTRAEARLFLGDKDGALEDLRTWEHARRECPAAVGFENNFVDFTHENIQAFYSQDSGKDFYGNPDKGYGIVKPIRIDEICPRGDSDATVDVNDIMPWLQCIQHMRRIETIHTGLRWFDVKRLGIEYAHVIGPESRVDFLSIDDPRRAVQIPANVESAGLQPNPRDTNVPTTAVPSSAYQRPTSH